MTDLRYACEKFTDAVTSMAASSAPLAERLLDAYVSYGVMRIDSLPEDIGGDELHQQLIEIHRAFNAGTPEANEGIAAASMNALDDAELEVVADKIVNVYLRLVSALEDAPDRT